MGIIIFGLWILTFLIGIAIILLSVMHVLRKRRSQPLQSASPACSHKFSVADYYGRMEQVSLNIRKEQEHQKPYELILWICDDGLRMKADGSAEWIKRGGERQEIPCYNFSPPPPQYPAPFTQYVFSSPAPYPPMPQQNLFNTQTQFLQNALQQSYISMVLSAQNQNMISAIGHPGLQTAQRIYHLTPINNCCCDYT